MAGLQGFASHGGGIQSRGCLAIVEAPGYPLPFKRGSWLNYICSPQVLNPVSLKVDPHYVMPVHSLFSVAEGLGPSLQFPVMYKIIHL